MSPPGADRLLELIDRMSGRRITMVVDLVADRFLSGLPKRISREAPVLILRQESDLWVPGGGANAVANVAALGGRPRLVGVVGRDEAGDRVLEMLEQRGVETDGVLRCASYRTPTKTRVLGGPRHGVKQQIVRFDVEDELVLDEEERRGLLERMRDAARETDAVVLSDYGYGLFAPDLLDAARALEVPVLADSRYRLPDFSGVAGATPNEEEAEALHGGPLGEGASLAAAGGALRSRLGVDVLLITRGSAGMALFGADGSALALPVHGSAQVADVTGAGDTVIGSFSLALAAGASAPEAACLATYAAGIVVMKHGTATTDAVELAAAIRSAPDLAAAIREIA